MAQRRPIVIVSGQQQELPAGDSIKGDLAFASIMIDGGGSTITTGVKGDIGPFAFPCEIEEVHALGDQTGSIQIDVWKDTYANFPPVDGDSITASAPIVITTSNKGSPNISTWTKSIAAGDVLRFNVDSVTSLQRVELALKLRKT